ncbi:MAG: 2-octaprenyl-6-methoxyphenyl hydroxylase [Gammaproteobacteria bacterium]|nr:MAG: 2-octaprenyl-6-methoxyphenyl hydroxylase [Gammaproteobacteria bacterium]
MNGQAAYDVLIVGGGMVGASLGLALSGQGLRIGLIDAHAPGDPAQPSYDDRAIALAWGSRRIFEGMGVWQDIADDAEPICEIHVSDRGHFGFTHLSAREEQVPALGYVATARHIGQVLLARLRDCADVQWIAPAQVVGVASDEQVARVHIERKGASETLQARLLVAADGGRSFVREALGLPTRQWQYGQSAVVTNVTPSRPHRNVAFERFTETGPIALLPMSEGRCAVVWTVRDEQVEEVMALDDQAFLHAFQARFGYRLGRFERVGRRASYPLSLLRVTESVRPRIALIGNAAHTLHPIAGQGFNLGLRDVAALVDLALGADAAGDDIGGETVLYNYERWRQRDQRNVALATDGLARIFSNPLPPVRLARNLGMLALDLLPPARHRLAAAAMGVQGRLPRLARGLPPR